MWQLRNISTSTDIGAPGPLPAVFDGLSAASLADISTAIPYAVNEIEGGAYAGHGFFFVPPPPTVPELVTTAAFKVALGQAGLLAQAEALINALPIEAPARILWTDAENFRRSNPIWNQMAAQMTPPLTPADVDAVFVTAGAISF